MTATARAGNQQTRRLRATLGAAALLVGVASAALAAQAITAAAVVPSGVACTGSGGEPEIFYVGGNKPGKNQTAQCDVILPSNGVILPGSTIGVYYNDETTLNTASGFAPTFTIDGVSQTIHTTNVGGGSQKYRFSLTITIPSTLTAGTHTAKVTAWDSDQNKTGGDFGQVIFSFGVSDGAIAISPLTATNTVGQQHVFTVTATALPFSSNLPVAFGAITTAVTPTPGTLSTTCASPSGSGNTRTCTITINSTTAGTFTANATVSMTINGQSLTRSTNSAVAPHGTGGSGPATKTYVVGAVQGATPTPAGGVLGIISVPNTGGGPGDGSAPLELALLAGSMGAVAAAGAVTMRRRTRRSR